MKKRNPLVVFLLSIVTFGIYDIYWLVKTKAVLNKETKYHTPTIWLLVAPFIILMAGYILIFSSAFSQGINTSSSNGSSSTTNSSSTGEQLNTQGERRPAQYVHICNTSGGIQYVTQGQPSCLNNDTYQSDYSSSVPGTVYSSPCATTTNPTRYVYINNNEACPSGTSLVFKNTLANNTLGIAGSTLVGFILILLGGFISFGVSIFWFYRFSQAIDEYTRGKMSMATTFLILWLVHLIGVALIQATFNDMEDGPQQPGQNGTSALQPQHQPSSSLYPTATSGIGATHTPPQPINQVDGNTPAAPPVPTPPPKIELNYSEPTKNAPAPIMPLPPANHHGDGENQNSIKPQ